MKSWLSNMRNADEAEKKRWVFGASAIAMIVVLIIWAASFRAFMKPETAKTTKNDGRSFVQILRDGAGAIMRDIGTRVSDGVRNITAPNEYQISK